MPLIASSDYSAPFYLTSGHAETIFPSLLGRAPQVRFSRERLELSDGDFLDLDWLRSGSPRCLVITHGLEGSSDRYYVRRTADYFHREGWDILAWNCRSCSGELNRLPRFYHHGDTADLTQIVEHASNQYQEMVLMGYSMGGSMSLKYLGEGRYPAEVKGAVTFSVPCNLRDSALELKKKSNRFYEQRFVKKLLVKVKQKAVQFPEIIEGVDLNRIREFDDFHRAFTVPLHGFRSLDDFFDQATCDQFFDQIKLPTLIVNAQNDPMLGEKCYPKEAASNNEFLFLEIPRRGGHTGFSLTGKSHSWMETRAEIFIQNQILQGQSLVKPN